MLEKKHHAKIKLCKLILKLDSDVEVTDQHLQELKSVFEQDIRINQLSPREIKEKYQIKYTNFGSFLKKCLGVKTLDFKESMERIRSKTVNRTSKKNFYDKCKFDFDVKDFPMIPGMNLLIEFGMYHPVKNIDGVSRDHIVSVKEAFENNYDPNHISHPANCQLISQRENSRKGESSDISYEDLKKRIDTFEKENVFGNLNKSNRIPHQKSKEHRQKISETNKKYMNVTNGIKNLRILKSDSIPDGFYQGMTRKKSLGRFD